MKKYNLAIIGLGVGERVLKSLKNHQRINKIKIFDFNKSKLKICKKKYSVEIYSTENEVYNDKDIDIVYIASYDNYHFAQCKKSLKANKHIFVEKPAFLYEHQAEEFKSLLNKKKKIALLSNMILRKSERFKYLKKKIKEKYFGEIYYVEGDYNYGRLNKITQEWRGKIPFYSVTLGGGLHIVDLLCWLLNMKVDEVFSYANKVTTKNTQFKYPDLITTIFKTNKKMIGKITSNFGCVYPHFHKISIYGTKKTFENNFNSSHIFEKRGSYNSKSINIPYLVKDKSLLFNDMLKCIENSAKRKQIKNEIFNSLKICYAIDKSIKYKKKIKIKY